MTRFVVYLLIATCIRGYPWTVIGEVKNICYEPLTNINSSQLLLMNVPRLLLEFQPLFVDRNSFKLCCLGIQQMAKL
ncbi:CLUMA_CG005204, isoform A [Clunio marinus]|uniref:CLUMA_CG005204, isoform A n=1 Tax=Clunio marinus TaxID=568069 RepID=A0A1J1HU69_9DIPT|nr:CLUMA_CG005204, isoform A [Clunio marinus]